MDKGDLIKYLYAMEKQAREIENQNSQLRSISESMKKLEQETKEITEELAWAETLGEEKPVFEEPTQVKSFDWFSAIIVWFIMLCFMFLLIVADVANSSNPVINSQIKGDFAVTLSLVLPIVCARYVGKFVAQNNKRVAEEEAALRNEKALKRWEAQMRHYKSRKQQIPTESAQLQSHYRAAEQAKKQAQSKLTKYGNSIGLHSHYWTTHALHEIWMLLDRGRADTLKEAINRYEADDSQRRHNEKIAYYASEQADAERRRAQAAEEQAEYARQQAAYSEQQSEYARQQAENTEAVRKDVAKMRSDQEWDRIDHILNH